MGAMWGIPLAPLNKLFVGKYRDFTFYVIKNGVDIVQDVINEYVVKQISSQPMDIWKSLEDAMGAKLVREMFGASARIAKKIKNNSKSLRSNISKASNANIRSKQWQEKAKNETDPKKRHDSKRKRILIKDK